MSETRLVDMTFMEYIVEFIRAQRDSGGKVVVKGLSQHVSSANHNRALKISLLPVNAKLSPRQERLKNFSRRKRL